MKIDLAGKTALVTGAASGIGKACAEILHDAGARIVVVDINLEGAEKTVAALGDGLAVRCDLGDPQDIKAMHDRVIAETGGIDILINCAGLISYKKGIGSVSVEEWDRVIDVNLRSGFLVCREFIEDMKARGWGKIVNFSSLAARIASMEAGIHYAISKGGLLALTKTLATEAAPFGIAVNAVAPGLIMTGPVQKQLENREAHYEGRIPLQRLGQPQDVAKVVLFLSSTLSDYVTGIVIDINGGMYMG